MEHLSATNLVAVAVSRLSLASLHAFIPLLLKLNDVSDLISFSTDRCLRGYEFKFCVLTFRGRFLAVDTSIPETILKLAKLI